jgi:hypothetical protein
MTKPEGKFKLQNTFLKQRITSFGTNTDEQDFENAQTQQFSQKKMNLDIMVSDKTSPNVVASPRHGKGPSELQSPITVLSGEYS